MTIESRTQDPTAAGEAPSPRPAPPSRSEVVRSLLLPFLLVVGGAAAVIGALVADDRGLISVFGAVHYFERGAAHQGMGRTEEARAEYARALARDPAMPEAHFNLAILEEARGDLPAARAALDRVAAGLRERTGRDVYAEMQSGLFWMRLLSYQAALAERAGDVATAERLLREAEATGIRTRSPAHWAGFRLARLALSRGAPAEARERLDTLVAALPEATYASVLRLERARTRLALGDAEGALEDLGVAVARAGDGAAMSRIIAAGATTLGAEGGPDEREFGAAAIARSGQAALEERARLHAARGDAAAAEADREALRRLRERRSGPLRWDDVVRPSPAP